MRNRQPLSVRGAIERGVSLQRASELSQPSASKPIDLAPSKSTYTDDLQSLDALRMRSDQDVILRTDE